MIATARVSFSPRQLLRRLRALTSGLFSAALIGSSAMASGEFVWGVNGHPFTAYPGVSYSSQLDLVRDLGARSYRVNVTSLDHIERLRDLVALGARRGIEILPVLTPPFDLKSSAPETLYANSFNFAFAIASAVRRHVKTIELGNELENHAIIQPCERQTDGRIYPCSYGAGTGILTTDYEGTRWRRVSAILKGLSDGTAAADPALKRAIGSAGWGHTGVFDLMQADGIRWEISVWHSYQQDPPEMLEKVAAFKKPIWITEFNFPVKLGGDLQEHALGLKKMIDDLRPKIKTFGIEAVHFYELLDEPYWGADIEAIMGLATLKKSEGGRGWEIGERKPAFEIARTAINGRVPTVARTCDLNVYRDLGRPKSVSERVEFAYCLMLGRAPDAEATENWGKALESGRTLDDLVVALADTDEFETRYFPGSANNSEFLHFAYDLLLGRKPDGGGLQTFLSELGRGLRRQDVIRGMVKSGEFADRFPLIRTSAGLR